MYRMKTVLYARVSTVDQSCDMQLRELRDYATRRGLHVDREYVDTGWSGAKTSRPELDRLMQDARLRRFDAVLVWKLDRWGRSVSHCIRSIQEIVSLGIRFIAATQNIDTDQRNPTSQFILHNLCGRGRTGARDDPGAASFPEFAAPRPAASRWAAHGESSAGTRH